MHSFGLLLTQYNDCLCLYQQRDPLRGLCNIIRRWLNVECAAGQGQHVLLYLFTFRFNRYTEPPCCPRGAADLLALLTFKACL